MSNVDLINSFNRIFETNPELKDGHFSVSEFPEGDQDAFGSLLTGFQNYCDGWSRNNSFDVKCGLVRSMDLNAFASYDREANSYLVGITFGTIKRVHALFHTIAASTSFYVDWGPAEFEGPFDLPAILFGNSQQIAQAQRLPMDEHRRAMSDCMFSMAIEFLFFHEWAHVTKGHIARAMKGHQSSKNFALGETQDIGKSEVEVNERQAMELDADQNAAYWCVTHYYQLNSPTFDGGYWTPPRDYLLEEEFSKLFLLLLAYYFTAFRKLEKALTLLIRNLIHTMKYVST